MNEVKVVFDGANLGGALGACMLLGWAFVVGVECIRTAADWFRSKFVPWNL